MTRAHPRARGSGDDATGSRRHRVRCTGPLLTGLLLLVACGPDAVDRPSPGAGDGASDAPVPSPVVDAEGRTVQLERPAERIVSLVPSVTATVRALGAGRRLVGRTRYDTAAALSDLPSVGGGLGPDLEMIAALTPDLVVRFAGQSDRHTAARLDDLGIPHLAVRPDRTGDIWTIVDLLGVALGLDDRAAALRMRLQGGLDAVRRSVADREPVRAAYLMGGSPPWTAGAGTYIDELVSLAGGINVLAGVEGLYGAVSPEEVATREVDVVLLAPGADPDERLLAGRRVVRLSPAVLIPGPGIVDAAREVARALHPDLGRGP